MANNHYYSEQFFISLLWVCVLHGSKDYEMRQVLLVGGCLCRLQIEELILTGCKIKILKEYRYHNVFSFSDKQRRPSSECS